MLNVALPGQSTLHGTIRDSGTGAGLPDAVVQLTSQGTPSVTVLALTDSSGDYSFSGLTSGAWVMTVSITGHETTTLPGLALAAGDQVQNAGLLPSTIVVQGTISGDVGPLNDATVSVVNASGAIVDSASTDATGAYQLISLAPGSYSIVASAAGYAASAAMPLTVAGGQTTSGFNLHLSAIALSDPLLVLGGSPMAVRWTGRFSALPAAGATVVRADAASSDFSTGVTNALNGPLQNLGRINLEMAPPQVDLSAAEQQALNAARAETGTACKNAVAAVDQALKAMRDTYSGLYNSYTNIIVGDVQDILGPRTDRLHKEAAAAAATVNQLVADITQTLSLTRFKNGFADGFAALKALANVNSIYDQARAAFKADNISLASGLMDKADTVIQDGIGALGVFGLFFNASQIQLFASNNPQFAQLLAKVEPEIQNAIQDLSTHLRSDFDAQRKAVDDFADYLYDGGFTNDKIPYSLTDYKAALMAAQAAWNTLLQNCPCAAGALPSSPQVARAAMASPLSAMEPLVAPEDPEPG
jgi:hypothetical protein